MARLFQSISLRGVTLANRVGVSPMCQYSSSDGFANDWHVLHLGSRAVGGAGLVIAEATAVEARGRISPHDLGIWKDDHIEPLARVVASIAGRGAVAGIQIAHAGRKAGTARPWEGGKPLSTAAGGWVPMAPSPIPFSQGYAQPLEASAADLASLRGAFRAAAARALEAGFRWLELHAAHGYLLHSFLSPLSNQRSDAYGGSFENRIRFVLEVVRDVRGIWPEALPLSVRLSCTDWIDGGWTLEESIELSRHLRQEGVDLVDCSSGGSSPLAVIPVAPGYQVPFAEAIRAQAGVRTAAVGLITEPVQAEAIVAEGRADLVFIGRAFLREPYWALHAAHALMSAGGVIPDGLVPPQYQRAF
jgi:2,4-dienoyl-CoA reductase-like NADH-dependent reductase (Old Yellow Enzyme family)